MRIIERISALCKENGTTVTTLEKELGYSNGSLAKAKDIPSSRIIDIAVRFNVSTDYILTGIDSRTETPDFEKEHIELITLYSQLEKEQKEAVFNLLRSFCSK